MTANLFVFLVDLNPAVLAASNTAPDRAEEAAEAIASRAVNTAAAEGADKSDIRGPTLRPAHRLLTHQTFTRTKSKPRFFQISVSIDLFCLTRFLFLDIVRRADPEAEVHRGAEATKVRDLPKGIDHIVDRTVLETGWLKLKNIISLLIQSLSLKLTSFLV